MRISPPKLQTTLSFTNIILLGATFAAAPAASADVILSWGGTGMTSTSQGVFDNGGVSALNSTTPLDTTAGNYLGPVAYGGLQFTNGTINRWRVLDGASGDILQSIVNATNTSSPVEQWGMFFFKQENFQALDSVSGGVTLNSSTPFSVEYRVPQGASAEFRFVIQTSESGDPYYISDDIGVAAIDATYRTGSLADPTSGNWSSFTPETSMASSSIGALGSPDFGGVTGVGLWWNVAQPSPTGSFDTNFNFRTLEFNAIPETNAFPAIAGLMAVGFVLMRRRPRR